MGDKANAIMSVMSDGAHLSSKAGLRSLSPTAPGGGPDLIYGTQEDYWRGKVCSFPVNRCMRRYMGGLAFIYGPKEV